MGKFGDYWINLHTKLVDTKAFSKITNLSKRTAREAQAAFDRTNLKGFNKKELQKFMREGKVGYTKKQNKSQLRDVISSPRGKGAQLAIGNSVMEKHRLLFDNLAKSVSQLGAKNTQVANSIPKFKTAMNALGLQVNSAADGFIDLNGETVSFSRVNSMAKRQGMVPFNASLLSMLFIGQGLSKTFGGMIKSVLRMTGVFDAFRGILASVLLPILMPLIAEWLPKLINWLNEGDHSKMVGEFIIFAAVLGTIIGPLMQILLLGNSLGLTWAGIGTFLTASFTSLKGFFGFIMKIAGVVVLLAGIFNIVVGILRDKLWPIVKGILYVAGAIAMIFGGEIVAAVAAAIMILVKLGDKVGWIRWLFMGILGLIKAIIDAVAWVITLGGHKGDFGAKLFKGAGANFKAGWHTADVPAFASGGVVSRPTLGLIGEAGPEAVIPLSKLGNMGSTINYNPTINVNTNSLGGDVDEIVELVNRKLADSVRDMF